MYPSMRYNNNYKFLIFLLFCFVSGLSSLAFAKPLADTGVNPFADDFITDEVAEKAIKSIFSTATRIDKKNPDTHVWPVYSTVDHVGYAFESKDFIRIQGFAGDIINLLIGIDNDGKIMGVRVLFQHEPIFMHGLGPEALDEFLEQYPGHSVSDRIIVDSSRSRSTSNTGEGSLIFDGVTKATVSVIAANDTLLTAALEVARKVLGKFVQDTSSLPKMDIFEPLTWQQLLDKKLVGHWTVTREQLENELGRDLSDYPGYGFDDPDLEVVSDIYYAYLNAPMIGKNLLGEQDYKRLMDTIKPGENIIGVMSQGPYDFLEDDFRPGKIPTRMSLYQNELPLLIRDMAFFRFYDRNLPETVPDLDNFRLLKIKGNAGFDPSQELTIQLNFDLRQNHLLGDNINQKSAHQLPAELFYKPDIIEEKRIPIWKRLWNSKVMEITITILSLILLTLIFVKQRALSQYPRVVKYGRWVFMFFTVFFIGFYAQGQLSVVNIYPILLSLRDGFKLDLFLLDPVLFIIWTYTFITLFIWGRGVFCGWLCPFGALQEILAWLGKLLKFPQLRIKEPIHRALQKLKYVIVVGLSALCFYDLGLAQTLSEIEPFKTSITLVFDREWYFVAFAVGLLLLGMFIHKFYCRYVCPLGAGLAVLGRFHIFKWLDRRDDCGKPCQVCTVRCEIKAIPKSGAVDYSECIQCLECLVIYNDEHQCAPVMVANKRARKQMVNLEMPSK
ncbi:MAG TPA: 4Fe-4S binding protein [Cycloclasticus sp.]|nr:4Fe-4S binding protein [Cycloclasticus sp.]HIL91553.1 4Fe-4S binding protein [Cycloclasticus sp.]